MRIIFNVRFVLRS